MKDTHWNMPPNQAKAIMLAKRQLAEFVCDAVNLEGINYTLLDGITVGGHRVSDQQIALNQSNAWRALYFLTMARYQFFYDVNKRMGRFVMNGLLLSNGYPAINLPAKRQLEFNRLMLDFYATGEQESMNTFLRSCLDERIIEIMKEEQIHGQAAHNH